MRLCLVAVLAVLVKARTAVVISTKGYNQCTQHRKKEHQTRSRPAGVSRSLPRRAWCRQHAERCPRAKTWHVQANVSPAGKAEVLAYVGVLARPRQPLFFSSPDGKRGGMQLVEGGTTGGVRIKHKHKTQRVHSYLWVLLLPHVFRESGNERAREIYSKRQRQSTTDQ